MKSDVIIYTHKEHTNGFQEREEMKMKTYTIKVVTNKRTVFETVTAESLEMAKKIAVLRVTFQW